MALTADELAAELRSEIRAGKFPVGTKLPSLTELVSSRGVGMGVAQQAIVKLRAEGLVDSRHGLGSYVKAAAPTLPTDESRRRVLRRNWADALPQGDGPGRRASLLRIDEVAAPDFVASQLRIKPGSTVVLRRARVDLDGRPAHIEDTYYPIDLARGTAIAYHDTGEGGIHARLAEKGAAPTRGELFLIARVPTADEAADLRLRATGAVVLEVIQTAWSGKRPVEVCRAVMDAELYQVAYDIG